uniref:F-box domain-containing protein n=1 Tax=Mycena chlorophos TaxID=658473 RepID=A0ABQ0LQ00_MYCCL|nr:predicted protein [Mycena chlorophos]
MTSPPTTLNLHLRCDRWETGKNPDVEALACVVDRWLLRAGSRPLDICLADLTEGPLDAPALRPLLQTLQRHSPRIGTFCMELYPNDFSLFEGHRMEFSRLVELSIASEDIEGSGPILRTFRHAPCLRRVHLSRLPLGSITVPREQIEEFSGRGCGAEEYLDALEALPKLTTCLLQPYLIDYDRDELPIITHTHLRHLTLEESDDEIFGFEDDLDEPRPIHILSFLTLPALESLELDGTQSFDGEILRAFVERSSPPLRKLSIAYDSGSLCITGSLDAFLLLPCLEDLAFGSPAPKLVIQFCSLLARNPSCLPRLKSLEITNEDESLSLLKVPSWVQEVGNALLARGRASSSLQSVRIVLGGEFTEFRPRKSLDSLMLFASLREKGVKVHFGTKDISAV